MKKRAKKKSKKKPAKKAVKRVLKKVVIKGCDPARIKALENELRDIINWVAVFEEEQNLASGSTQGIRDRLYDFANKLGRL